MSTVVHNVIRGLFFNRQWMEYLPFVSHWFFPSAWDLFTARISSRAKQLLIIKDLFVLLSKFHTCVSCKVSEFLTDTSFVSFALTTICGGRGGSIKHWSRIPYTEDMMVYFTCHTRLPVSLTSYVSLSLFLSLSPSFSFSSLTENEQGRGRQPDSDGPIH